MPVMTDEGAEAVPAGTDAELDVSTELDSTQLEADADGELDESADSPETGAQSEDAAKPARRTIDLRTALISAAFAVLVLLAGFLGWKVWEQQQLNQAREEAQRAAVSYAQVLTSIDSDNVDENFKQVLDGATGEFKDMYSQSSVELRQLLVENKATANGLVVESAVQSVSKDKAVVLLFVDQSVSNTKLPDPRIDRSRMKMTLEKVDGRWLASQVELP